MKFRFKILIAIFLLILSISASAVFNLNLNSSAEAATKRIIKFGVLRKLNTTEEEFGDMWRRTFAPNNERLEIIIKFYDSLVQMQMALSAGEINQMVLPEAAANYVVSQAGSEYEITLTLRSKNAHGLSFGFREDSAELRDKFSKALQALKDDWRLAAIEGRYISSAGNVAEIEPVKFEKFENAPTVKVAVTGDLPPIDFIRADGTPAGFNTAVLAEIGKFLGVNIELVNVDAGARTAALASGRVDVVFWYEVDTSSKTQPDVPDGVILSEPYYYEWNNFLHVKKALKRGASNSDSHSEWDAKKSIWEMIFSIP